MHVLEHSVGDTLRLVPFLFVTYLAMEALEHASADRVQAVVERSGKAGPAVARCWAPFPSAASPRWRRRSTRAAWSRSARSSP